MDVREKLVEQLRWWATECDRTNFGCQARKLLVEAADYIVNGVTVQEWISVKDRLPEKREFVLFSTGNENIDKIHYGYLCGGDRWIDRCSEMYYHDVTHWMPMPPAPKGE